MWLKVLKLSKRIWSFTFSVNEKVLNAARLKLKRPGRMIASFLALPKP